MTKFAIVDVANLFHRARHVVRGDAFQKSGMALSIMFNAIRKLFRDYRCDHIVLCTEGRSWRHEVFPGYKGARRAERAKLNESDKEEDELFFQTLTDFQNFMAEKTRATVLHSDGIEGDDFVARWIQLHPNDQHVILSGDSDFVQLLAANVSIYDGVQDHLIAFDGVFNDKGEPMMFSILPGNGKIKVISTIKAAKISHDKQEKEKLKRDTAYELQAFDFTPEPEWWRKALFIKIIRGDTSDSIFSANPGVRYEGSKTKAGIREAWEDRSQRGFHWNNFMLQKWDKLIGVDENGNKITKSVRVLDEFNSNASLIDLTQQPREIIDLMDQVIVQAVQKEPVGNVGVHFLRFCDKHDLPRLSKDAGDHAHYLNLAYSMS